MHKAAKTSLRYVPKRLDGKKLIMKCTNNSRAKKKKMSSRQRTNSTQEKAAAVVGLVGVGENQFSDKTSVLSVRNS